MDRKYFKYMVYGFCMFLVFKPVFLPGVLFDWGFSTFKTEQLMGGFLILIIFSLDGMYAKMKQESPILQGYNFSSTHSFKPEDELYDGDWAYIRTGGINAWGVSEKGKRSTLVCPWPAYKFTESGIFVNAHIQKNVPKSELPTEVKKFVDRNELPTPIHLAVAPANVEANNQAFIDWKQEWQKMNQGENTVQGLLDKGFQLSSQIDHFANSKTDKVKGEIQRLKEKMEDNDSGG